MFLIKILPNNDIDNLVGCQDNCYSMQKYTLVILITKPAQISAKSCILSGYDKNNLQGQKYIIVTKDYQQPLKVQDGLFHTYYINMYEIIHQNEKGP